MFMLPSGPYKREKLIPRRDTMDDVVWEAIKPGKIQLGSENRTVIFGGIGPKHEVEINYEYEISKYPVKRDLCDKLIADGCNIASESEWFLALRQNKIFGENITEELSDRIANSYWGKICDGSAFIASDWIYRVGRRWRGHKSKEIRIEKSASKSEYYRLIKNKRLKENIEKKAALPHSSDKKRLLMQEILICITVGIIPSFIWAYFNASSDYVREGWLNLVFGGLFIGFFTILFWRPRTKTWLVKDMVFVGKNP